MKKIIFISIILLFLTISFKLIVNAKNNDQQWSKINNYIYIDKNSIIKNGDTVSAWFKFYSSPKYELIYEKFNNTPVYYEITKYEVGCDIDALFYTNTKFYDKNNNLLYDEVNNHDVGANCNAYINGDIICKALCGK